MSITVELPQSELAEIRERTNLSSDEDALILAAREFLRLQRLQELKLASGNVEYSDHSDLVRG
ncbi:MAG: hypothetical protein AAF236_16420 [Verrucomicrobiota bacterium]